VAKHPHDPLTVHPAVSTSVAAEIQSSKFTSGVSSKVSSFSKLCGNDDEE
jgi:hypothetical protein